MIKQASKVYQKMDKTEFEKACDSVMKDVELASAQGLRDCCFNPYPSNLYGAVKDEFQKYGYSFRPTGYVSGIWQQTEQICW